MKGHFLHGKTILRRRMAATALMAAAFSVLLSALAAVPAKAAAQFDNTGRGTGYTAVLYDNSNGLPTSEANAIAQTENGFIWIGGYSGLIRYDGNEFYRYPSTTGISSVVCLFVDSKDRIWIGTNDNGVAMLEDGVFTLFNSEEALGSSSIRSITEEDSGDIIIATTMGLACIDEELELHKINEPQLNKEYICELVHSNDDTIYGVTLSGVMFSLKDKRVSSYYNAVEMGYDTANTIYPDPFHPGYVYIGTQGDYLIYGNMDKGMSNIQTISVAPQNIVNYIRVISGAVWVCADNGIGYLDKNNNYVELLDLPMNNSIDKMLYDYEENLWFCSSRQGVMKIVKNRFTDISNRAALEPRVVNSTCKYKDELYIGTDTGLIVLDKNYERITNAATELLDGVRIRCIRMDSDNKMWFCTYNSVGLVRYDPETGEYICLDESLGLASNCVRMVKPLSDGRLAVATNGGMNIVSGSDIIATYNSKEGISNTEILCIEESSDGKLYLGSDGDGIYIVEGQKVSRIGISDGLRSEVILRIKKDPVDDIYWIITSNSIAYMKDGQITSINNFPYSNNFDIYFDSKDRIWVLSSNGIYVVKRTDMIEDLSSGETMDYTLYDTTCGLPSVATANSFSHQESNGFLYISGSTGVSMVDINDTSDNNKEIKLSIPYIMADDRYISVEKNNEVHIPADCKRLTIYANAFTYSLNNPNMAYYLDGFDDEPIEVSKRNMEPATYTNLDGGTYRYHISLINTMTGQEDQSTELVIIKDKRMYEYFIFRALMFILGVLIVTCYVSQYFRKKNEKLNKQAEERKSLINQMTSVFAKCIDMKDRYTNGHSMRVAKYSAMFAERLGKTPEEVEQIYNIALLHDIGKISIPDNILNKPGRLTDEEFAIMKKHSSNGQAILSEIKIAPELALGAGTHHERLDGKGYPHGLEGDAIPEVGQIIAVADTFDAMFSTRPYRKKLGLDVIAQEIKRVSGTQLSPKVVDVLMQLINEGVFTRDDAAEDIPVDNNEIIITLPDTEESDRQERTEKLNEIKDDEDDKQH